MTQEDNQISAGIQEEESIPDIVDLVFQLPQLSDQEKSLCCKFSPLNREYFRQMYVRSLQSVNMIRPDLEHPHKHMIELAAAQAAMDIYLSLFNLALESNN